jgi:hypothetical protein
MSATATFGRARGETGRTRRLYATSLLPTITLLPLGGLLLGLPLRSVHIG